MNFGKNMFEKNFTGSRLLPLPECVHFLPGVDNLPALELEVSFILDENYDNLVFALQVNTNFIYM